MTVETATVSIVPPPKKRDYNTDYPIASSCGPLMDPHAAGVGDGASLASCKSEPIKSGFMITDILSPPPAALTLGAFAPHHHHLVRVPSPHDTASSDAGSYKENDISDEGEGMLN